MLAMMPGCVVVTFLLLLSAPAVEGGCHVDELPDKPGHADREGGPANGEAGVGTEVTYRCKTGYEIIGDPVPYVTEGPTTTTSTTTTTVAPADGQYDI